MKRNRTKLFAWNTTAIALQQVVMFVVGLIIPSICLKYYGSEINGLISSITQFISYITLIEAGISASIVYYLYKPLSDNDNEKISSIVSAARITYRKLGFAVVALSFLLALGYMLLSHVQGLSNFDIFLLVLAMSVSGSLEFFTMSRYRVLLTADQRTYVICLATIVGSILNAVVTVLCAVLGLSIVSLKFIAIFTVYARSLVLSIYFRKKYKNINVKATPDYSSQNKRWDALYMQILWNVQSGAPILIVTAFTDFVCVSVYTIYNLVMYGISNLVSIFISGLQSAFGEIMVSGDKEKLRKTYDQFTYVFYLAITFIYAIAFAMFMPFIKIYTAGLEDADIYIIPILGVLFCVNGLLFSLKAPQGMMLMAAGHYKETKVQNTIQGVIIVLGGILFTGVFKWEIYGVVIASLISNLYRLIDFVIYVEKNIVKGSWKGTIFNIFSCFCIVVAVFLISPYISFGDSTALMWVLNAIVVGLLSISIILIMSLIFQRKNFFDTVQRVRNLFMR